MPKTVVRNEGEHLYATEPASPAGKRLSDAILHLRRAERLQADRAVRSSQLSNVDLTALRYLVQGARDNRKLSPKDLIVMLDTSSATVTNVVERLVTRGLLIREMHPTDRRGHYLVPTESAIQHVDASFAKRDKAVVGIIDGVTDAAADAAAQIIEDLARALDAIGEEQR